MDEKDIIIEHFSDYEFLSYLYSERDREERLNSYQGWNLWAVVGALITVICAAYTILCKHLDEIAPLNVGYLLSGVLGFLLCYRPFFFFLSLLFSRERGVDYKKVKYLKEITPKPYLWFSLFISIGFSVLFLICDDYSPISAVSVCWIIASLLFVGVVVYGFANKDKIVWSVIHGVLFGDRQLDSWLGGVLSCTLSVAWLQSFKHVKGDVIGSPDFELAICLAAVVALFYLLFEMKSGEKMSTKMDVYLDDYLYKGRKKESIYNQIRIHRLGYGVLEACACELYEMQDLFKSYDHQKKKVEEVIQLLSDGSFDINHMIDYFDTIKSASKYTEECNAQAKALSDKLDQIGNQVPRIEEVEDYRKLVQLSKALLEKEKEVLNNAKVAAEKMKVWLKVYHCSKYGGWRVKDCPHRNDRKSWAYRIELLQIKFAQRFGKILQPQRRCKE